MRNISVMTASFLTFWCYLFTSMISINCDIYLDTAYGRFRGKIMESRKGRNFSAFRGVPYASPPIGSLRFSDPVLATPRFVKAQSDKARCIQRIVSPMEDEIIGVEECLHLNIYTPLLANRQKSSMPRYPVMVWIHGGGFQTGSGHSSYYSPTYLLDHNIVLVTLNYRLGPFGFLSTGDEVMPGNYGLKDQLAALKWVNKYIVFFAGDTGSITLFGNGAGAASAYYFMMASGTEDLFHRVIAQSGTPFNPWAFQTPKMAREVAEEIGEQVGCPLKKSIEFLSCLREKKPEEILAAQQTLPGFDIYPHRASRPVLEKNIDGAFLIREPMDMHHQLQVPVMMGFTTHEGALHTAALYDQKNDQHRDLLKTKFHEVIAGMLHFDYSCSPSAGHKTSEKLYERYIGAEGATNTSRFEIMKMLSVGLYNNGIIKGLSTLSRERTPVYFYEFGYEGRKSHSKLFGDPENNYGVAHRDELQYLFPITEQHFPGFSMSKKDSGMIDVMTQMWYNFAKYGNPTPDEQSNLPFVWAPTKIKKPLYLSIGDPRNITMVMWPNDETLKFWINLPCQAGFSPRLRTPRDEL